MSAASRRTGALRVGLVLVAILLVWGRGLTNPLLGDDAHLLREWLRARATHASLLSHFKTLSWGVFFRPIGTLFNNALFSLFYPATWPMHLVALGVYAAATLAVARLARLVGAPPVIQALAALVFLTLPAHAEPVLWIATLHGMLENTLTLWAVIFLIESRRGAYRPRRMAAGLGLYALAVFTKESGIAAIGIVLAHDLLWRDELAPRARRAGQLVALYGGLVGAAGLYLALRSRAFQGWEQFSLNTVDLGFVTAAVVRTIVGCFSPVPWHWIEARVLPGPGAAAGTRLVLLVVAVAPFAFAVWRRNRVAIWLWLCLGGVLAPLLVVGVVPGERHLFLPSAFAAVLLGLGFRHVMERVPLGLPLLAAWLGVQAWSAGGRVHVWSRAAAHAEQVLNQTVTLYPTLPNDTLLLYLGVPDQIDGALVFRFGNLGDFLRARYGEPTLEAHMVATPSDIPAPMLDAPGAVQFTINARGGYLFWPEGMHGGPFARHDKELKSVGFLAPAPLLTTALEHDRPVHVLVYDPAERILEPAPGLERRMAGRLYEVRY